MDHELTPFIRHYFDWFYAYSYPMAAQFDEWHWLPRYKGAETFTRIMPGFETEMFAWTQENYRIRALATFPN